MKYIPHALSFLTFVIVCFYIKFDNNRAELSRTDSGQRQNNLPLYQVDHAPGGEYTGYLNAVSLDIPTEISFAGERVPLEIPDVRERLDRELLINTYWHSSTIVLIKKAHRWLPQIEEILKENGVPDDFKYLTAIEGGFANVVSPANAVGFWQILESSGEENGLEIDREVDERYDPLKATEAACKYLKKSYNKFGNWTSVAASYNRGMAGLQRAIDNQKVDSYYDLLLNEETSRYVFRILAIKEIIEHPKKYGFNIEKQHLYDAEELRYVEVDHDIKDLIAFAHDQGINYKLLKRHNPWLRDDHLDVSRNKTYKIAIPVNP
ncbi:lytic transglycosylase domain-containing protein [Fulvivirga ligni]|uniref:lytic transglycosylase domain-containing protein n=1 Tax=Fulvivirga ligni TaxID=2904246 RepID=UPI001F46F111|nr:lytic transglycosylase domain-containing protein [Fulvivirga ligni]UII22061.1 transglycosylase SLT domain-containing protein [Fulvivirga ligni]